MDLLETRTWQPWIWVWTLGTAWRTNFEISLAFSSVMPVTSLIVLADGALGGRLDRAGLERLERDLAADRLLLEHLIGGLQAILGAGGQLDRLVLQLEEVSCS